MIAIIDYGAGNIFSVKNALNYLGLAGELTSDPEAIRKADALILPGVGAFPSAMQMLHDSGLTNIIQEEAHKKPFLGICLGMQLIFEKGYEFEECNGLGLIPGKVEKIVAPDMVIPHMGWNKLEMQHNRLGDGTVRRHHDDLQFLICIFEIDNLIHPDTVFEEIVEKEHPRMIFPDKLQPFLDGCG